MQKVAFSGTFYFLSTVSTLSTMPQKPVFSGLHGLCEVSFFFSLCYNHTALKKQKSGEYMGELTLYKEQDDSNTVVSNCFIDHYLADANDAQIKVYLYLLRTLGAGLATSVSAMADKFNHTEKDIQRSLIYWEEKGLLSLDYNREGHLCGIRMRSVKAQESASFTPFVTLMPAMPHKESSNVISMPKAEPAFEKPNYTLDELKAFREKEDTAELVFIAEQYLKKTLSANDIRSILFLSETLQFSNDLIDYLLQYCVQRGKKDFRYIEKVAINWAEENITTPKEAGAYVSKYDRNVYSVMNALGKSNAPTSKEVDFIKRWYQDWGFSLDIILEACERTVLATDKHRFEYADKILSGWKDSGVHHKKDIEAADSLFRKSKPLPASGKVTVNTFNQFKQNDYDFNAIEERLLSRK